MDLLGEDPTHVLTRSPLDATLKRTQGTSDRCCAACCAEFDEFSPGPASAREAGRLAALLAALSTAVGLLHVLCMPCTRSAAHPENPLQTLHDVTTDSRGFVASWTNVPHCRLLSGFSLLPTNAYICKRLFTDHASLGVKARAVCCVLRS